MNETVRTHVLLPRKLVEEIDRLVGQRHRSQFLTEAAEAKLLHQRQSEALAKTAGILDPANYPEWETPEQVSAWVHTLRREDDEHRARKLQDWGGSE